MVIAGLVAVVGIVGVLATPGGWPGREAGPGTAVVPPETAVSTITAPALAPALPTAQAPSDLPTSAPTSVGPPPAVADAGASVPAVSAAVVGAAAAAASLPGAAVGRRARTVATTTPAPDVAPAIAAAASALATPTVAPGPAAVDGDAGPRMMERSPPSAGVRRARPAAAAPAPTDPMSAAALAPGLGTVPLPPVRPGTGEAARACTSQVAALGLCRDP